MTALHIELAAQVLASILEQADIAGVDEEGAAVLQIKIDADTLDIIAALGAAGEDNEDSFDQEEACEDEGAVETDMGVEDVPIGGLIARGGCEDDEEDDPREPNGDEGDYSARSVADDAIVANARARVARRRWRPKPRKSIEVELERLRRNVEQSSLVTSHDKVWNEHEARKAAGLSVNIFELPEQHLTIFRPGDGRPVPPAPNLGVKP